VRGRKTTGAKSRGRGHKTLTEKSSESKAKQQRSEVKFNVVETNGGKKNGGGSRASELKRSAFGLERGARSEVEVRVVAARQILKTEEDCRDTGWRSLLAVKESGNLTSGWHRNKGG